MLEHFGDSFLTLFVTRETGAFVDGSYVLEYSSTFQLLAITPQAATPNEIITLPIEAGERWQEVLVAWAEGAPVRLGDLVAYNGETYRVLKEQIRAEGNLQRFVFGKFI